MTNMTKKEVMSELEVLRGKLAALQTEQIRPPAGNEALLPASEQPTRPKEIIEEEAFTGRGKILFMDDEDLIRNLGYEILSLLGYEVVLVIDGQEAIVSYGEAQKSSAPFDAVIMDLTVPGGMGGYEAMQVLRKMDPNVRAIVSSGYSTDPIMADYKTYGFKGIVPKPYTVQDLSQILHQVMRE